MSEVEINPGMEASTPAAQNTDVVVTQLDQKSPLQTAPMSADPKPPSDSKLDSLKKGKSVEAPSIDKPATPPPVAVNPYQPNFKFKVNKEEKDIDDFFKPLIKDAESEKKVKELLEKSFGHDFQKPKFEKVKADFEEISTKYNNIDKALIRLSSHLNKGDMESYCQELGITDDKILKYAQQILQKMEMDPSQRAELERVKNDRIRASQLQEDNQALQTDLQKQKVDTGLMQTEMLLSKPEYAQVAQAYDSHVKKPGAFFEEVCKQGIYAERTTGKILSPEEAIQAAISNWSPFLQGQAAPPQAAAPGDSPQAAVKTPPPTLPNVSGRGSSPIKQGVKSIADLKKIQQQLSKG